MVENQKPKLSKKERRFVQISRILRKRNYGFQKTLNTYSDKIYRSIYTKTDTEQASRAIYSQLKQGRASEAIAQESLQDVFARLNKRLSKLGAQLPKIFQTLLMQGSQKVFTADAKPLKLRTPNYTKTIGELAQNNLKYVRDVTNDQRKKMVDIISQGIKDGKTYAQMGDDIQKEIKDMSQNRARLIADNESHKAHALAMEKTMKHNGIKKYQWLSAADDRVSPICQSLHRQIFEYGKVGKMQWRDVNGKTYNINKSPRPIRDSHIRCRCVTIAVVD